jgi:hypothetical protein
MYALLEVQLVAVVVFVVPLPRNSAYAVNIAQPSNNYLLKNASL